MCYRTYELSVLYYTPIGVKGIVCPWCFALCLPPRQTAEEQSAAFALISELLDANALDYHADLGNSLRALSLAFSYIAYILFSFRYSVGVTPYIFLNARQNIFVPEYPHFAEISEIEEEVLISRFFA